MERSSTLDFTHPFLYSSAVMVYRKQEVTHSLGLIFSPLTTWVIVALLGSWLATSVLICGMEMCAGGFHPQQQNSRSNERLCVGRDPPHSKHHDCSGRCCASSEEVCLHCKEGTVDCHGTAVQRFQPLSGDTLNLQVDVVEHYRQCQDGADHQQNNCFVDRQYGKEGVVRQQNVDGADGQHSNDGADLQHGKYGAELQLFKCGADRQRIRVRQLVKNETQHQCSKSYDDQRDSVAYYPQSKAATKQQLTQGAREISENHASWLRRWLVALDTALHVTGSVLLCEASQLRLASRGGRMLLSSWSLLALVVAAAYSGTLTAFLSVTTQPRLFSSLDDLVQKQHRYTWGTFRGNTLALFLENSTNPTHHEVWKAMIKFSMSDPDIFSSDMDTLVHKVLTEDFVLLSTQFYVDTLLGGHCGVQVVPVNLRTVRYGVVVPHGSSLVLPLSQVILDLYSSGLLSQWTDRWFPRVSCPPTSADPVVISLLHVQGLLLVLPVGLGLALGVLVMERLFLKRSLQGMSRR